MTQRKRRLIKMPKARHQRKQTACPACRAQMAAPLWPAAAQLPRPSAGRCRCLPAMLAALRARVPARLAWRACEGAGAPAPRRRFAAPAGRWRYAPSARARAPHAGACASARCSLGCPPSAARACPAAAALVRRLERAPAAGHWCPIDLHRNETRTSTQKLPRLQIKFSPSNLNESR